MKLEMWTRSRFLKYLRDLAWGFVIVAIFTWLVWLDQTGGSGL